MLSANAKSVGIGKTKDCIMYYKVVRFKLGCPWQYNQNQGHTPHNQTHAYLAFNKRQLSTLLVSLIFFSNYYESIRTKADMESLHSIQTISL